MNKKQLHRKGINAIYIANAAIDSTDSYSTGGTTGDAFIAFVNQGTHPDENVIASIKQVSTGAAPTTRTLTDTSYARTTSGVNVGITPLSVAAGYHTTESLIIAYNYQDRATAYNDYGNKYDLPDFYGAGLVTRMAKDVSTKYA